MARAIEWSLQRSTDIHFLAINIGSDEWNFKISDLAKAVLEVIPNTTIQINKSALPDKRSYQVDFSLFNQMAIGFQPIITLEKAIEGLISGLTKMEFSEPKFRNSKYLRLNVLNSGLESGRLNQNLEWIK